MMLCKSMVIAFSLYSKIPMPQFPWEEQDMRYMLCFFPWVGAVIGSVLYGWFVIAGRWGVGSLCYSLIGAAIPVLLTGGFHIDGFMDTMDALHSYQKKEKKLEILKDSHIGAFSVIMVGLVGILYVGCFSEIHVNIILRIVCGGFFLSRVLSGISVVTFSPAKEDGMLRLFADQSKKMVVLTILLFQGIVCAGWMVYQSQSVGLIMVLSILFTFLYYHWKTKKEFGGVTGDTAGYFVVMSETVLCIVAALCEQVLF